jgi:molybdate-binding protein/DNA-binding transcriptional regulator YhcF (GntR family)
MPETYLYQKIADSIRQDILNGELKPGDRLPSLRQMTSRWGCTTGTVQRAYHELAQAGLVVSRAGQGTRVVQQLPSIENSPLRRATLIHRAEAFLLEVLTAGYTQAEVEGALRQALERWQVISQQPDAAPEHTLRYAGSHDLALAWLASISPEIMSGFHLQVQFAGSLGGLMALAGGHADIAGCHLWDEDSDCYNAPFVRRVLPGVRVALLTLAHRRLGLILPRGNPKNIKGLEDLLTPGLRFVNRQGGSGSRVWLDANLRMAGFDSNRIAGYKNEKMTHSAVAESIASNDADVGLGLETSAMSYTLDFVLLTRERFDLVIPQDIFETEHIQALVTWLRGREAKEGIQDFGGYDTTKTGQIEWVD